MPSVTLLLLDLFPTMRGMASSLQGFVQFALSAVVAGTIAPFLAHSLSRAGARHGRFTLAGFALWLVYQRRARAHLKVMDTMKRIIVLAASCSLAACRAAPSRRPARRRAADRRR